MTPEEERERPIDATRGWLGVDPEHAKDLMSRMIAVFPGQRVIICPVNSAVE